MNLNMSELSQRAIDFAEKNANIILDYTKASLNGVDDVLEQVKTLFDRKIFTEAIIFDLSVVFGAYCGETFLRDRLNALGYIWKENEDNIPILVSKDGKMIINPVAKIYKDLIKDKTAGEATDKMLDYYDVFLMMLEMK